MTDGLADEVLVLRAQMGSRDALGDLHQRHHASVSGYLSRLVGDAHAVDDLSQEVWLTVVRRVNSLRNPAMFSVWLYRIARNAAFSRHRALARRPVDATDVETIIDPHSGADPPCTPDELNEAFDALSSAQREALTLNVICGHSYDEIAEITDVPVGTVRSRIYHARSRIRAHLKGPEA